MAAMAERRAAWDSGSTCDQREPGGAMGPRGAAPAIDFLAVCFWRFIIVGGGGSRLPVRFKF
jgi:hypothetical protein